MTDYDEWLRNAYWYYWGVDKESTMSDFEWDRLAKKFAKESDKYPELKNTNYEGGSLFWLSKDKYPDWIKE